MHILAAGLTQKKNMSAPESSSEMPPNARIPIEHLVQGVFAAFTPKAQNHMLAQLVGKVYAPAPVP